MKKKHTSDFDQTHRDVDFELKTYHKKFCAPSSKMGGAMGPQNSVIFEKNVIFRHLHPLKIV